MRGVRYLRGKLEKPLTEFRDDAVAAGITAVRPIEIDRAANETGELPELDFVLLTMRLCGKIAVYDEISGSRSARYL